MFLDEAMRLEIGVYGDDDFLQQSELFYICSYICADAWYTSKLNSFIKNKRPAVKIIPFSFFRRNAVQVIARDLLGKVLVTCFEGMKTSGRIVETEAYAGVTDRASHAFGGRLTERTRVMYEPGGLSYVYLCYGMHHLCNVVTNDVDVPHAVLIRALEPMDGVDVMQLRTGGRLRETQLCSGPGRLSKALGISTKHTGLALSGALFFLGDDGYIADKSTILATPRIGVDYAGEDAVLPYRFILRGHPCVSGRKS